jgi:hypothetical protein
MSCGTACPRRLKIVGGTSSATRSPCSRRRRRLAHRLRTSRRRRLQCSWAQPHTNRVGLLPRQPRRPAGYVRKIRLSNPKRRRSGRYWFRTSDLCRVKASGGCPRGVRQSRLGWSGRSPRPTGVNVISEFTKRSLPKPLPESPLLLLPRIWAARSAYGMDASRARRPQSVRVQIGEERVWARACSSRESSGQNGACRLRSRRHRCSRQEEGALKIQNVSA